MLLSHIFLTPPTKVYHTINVKKKIATTKFWKVFKLSHSIVMGGGSETMFNQITFIFSEE